MKRYLIAVILLSCTLGSSFSQVFTDSNLPIVLINTDGGVGIPDAPRVLATMTIINRGEGIRNYVADQDTPEYIDYKGRISIETRGSSSQVLDKKQYGFSTLLDDNYTEKNVKLLGMPADNDWILNGFGFEPGFMRDYICYNLSRRIGEYSSRTAYCEIVLNGNYIGIYLLEEKVKQGSKRVDVTNLEPTENSYPKITGGYIVKSDRGDPAWYMSSYYGNNDVPFVIVAPKPEFISASQKAYIHNEFDKFSNTISTGNASFIAGFPSVIDIPSFVDYMILNELGSNADAYQISTFYHKDRNGKLRAGPLWDLNLTFGYDLSIWGFDRSKTNNLQFENGDNEGARFWRDLYNDQEFRCCLYKRWNELIAPGHPLNYNSLVAFIDSTADKIGEAVARDNQRWYSAPDFPSEVSKIKNFILARIPFLTSVFRPASNCPDVVIPPLVITKIMYHPDSTMSFPGSESQEFIEITNTGSKTVDLTGVYFKGTGFVYQFPPYSQIFPNSSRILAGNAETFTSKYGFPPFGQFTRSLSNSGERIVLADGFGNTIDSVYYHDTAPWPNADGNGYYLELTDPLSDNSLAQNWILSSNTLVSVNETENGDRLKLYPLPVRSDLTIEYSGRMMSIEVFDFQGRMIKRSYPETGLYNLEMNTFPPGIYLIRIATAEGTFIRKIVKE